MTNLIRLWLHLPSCLLRLKQDGQRDVVLRHHPVHHHITTVSVTHRDLKSTNNKLDRSLSNKQKFYLTNRTKLYLIEFDQMFLDEAELG